MTGRELNIYILGVQFQQYKHYSHAHHLQVHVIKTVSQYTMQH